MSKKPNEHTEEPKASLLDFLGAKTTDEAKEIMATIAQPWVAVTILASPVGELNIVGTGGVSAHVVLAIMEAGVNSLRVALAKAEADAKPIPQEPDTSVLRENETN